jgi:hypothetical protein
MRLARVGLVAVAGVDMMAMLPALVAWAADFTAGSVPINGKGSFGDRPDKNLFRRVWME